LVENGERRLTLVAAKGDLFKKKKEEEVEKKQGGVIIRKKKKKVRGTK